MYAEPMYLRISKRIGYCINNVPNPRQTNANCKPWPVGIPRTLGIDRVNPNLIPEAVKILLFGPGVTYIIKLYIANPKINSHVITLTSL